MTEDKLMKREEYTEIWRQSNGEKKIKFSVEFSLKK